MPDDLYKYSDEALLGELARRLQAGRLASSGADAAEADVATLNGGLPVVVIPQDLDRFQHDAQAIRRLFEAGLRAVSVTA